MIQLPSYLTEQQKESIKRAMDLHEPVLIRGIKNNTGKTTLKEILRKNGVMAYEPCEFQYITLNQTLREDDEEMLYPVVEIFDSVQGEGEQMGRAVTFVRFAGCNLHCTWCDSKVTWNPNAKKCTAEEIVALCNKTYVVLTGGEPCIHVLEPLIEALHVAGHVVCIETNGTLPVPDKVDWITCSPKPPFYEINTTRVPDEVKYVVDKDFQLTDIKESLLYMPVTIWLQPCDYGEDVEATKQSIQKAYKMAMEHDLRLGIQMHKYLNLK